MSRRSNFIDRKHETMDTWKDPWGKHVYSRRRENELNHKLNKKLKARAKRKLTGK